RPAASSAASIRWRTAVNDRWISGFVMDTTCHNKYNSVARSMENRMDITELLAFSAKQNASDLHLSAGLPPMIRVDGDIRRLNVPAMDDREVRKLIYDIMADRQ